jgi:hypothetical protein
MPSQMALTPNGDERLCIILSPVHRPLASEPVLAEQASPMRQLVTKATGASARSANRSFASQADP